MTAKPETNFWKNLKTCLEDGNFLVSREGAPVYILVYDPDARTINVFDGVETPKLRQKEYSKVNVLWRGPVSRAPAALVHLAEAHKLPNSRSYPQAVDK
jgi:hypothetical protein